jgi:hypothetical protein
MIVLSDGYPASSGPHHDGKAMKLVMEELVSDGRVEMYGIGIEDETVKEYYPKWKVIKSGNQVEQALLEVLQQQVIG